MFNCPYCHAPFVTYSSLLNHKRYDHPAQRWPKKPARIDRQAGGKPPAVRGET